MNPVTDEWLNQMQATTHHGYRGRWLGNVLCFDLERGEMLIIGGRLARPSIEDVESLCRVFEIHLPQ